MNLRATMALVLRYLYLLKSSPTRVISLYIWVAIDIVLWGFISNYLNLIGAAGFNFVPAFLGAVLLSDFFARVILGITTAFFEDVWSRNFLNIFASPLRISEYLGGLVLTGVLTSMMGLVFMLLLAWLCFGLSPFAYGWLMIPFVGILYLTGIALGIVGCAVVLRLGPASEWFIWPIPALIAPFAGVFYPVHILPHWMQVVSSILPPSYVFGNLRALLANQPPDLSQLALGSLLGLGYIIASCLIFMLSYRHAVRTGLIARYSAETIN